MSKLYSIQIDKAICFKKNPQETKFFLCYIDCRAWELASGQRELSVNSLTFLMFNAEVSAELY